MQRTSAILPAEDRLLLRETEDEKTASGLVLAYTKNKSAKAFEVIAVGPGKIVANGSRGPMMFLPGDRVWVDLSMAYEVHHGGQKYSVVETAYVWAYERD